MPRPVIGIQVQTTQPQLDIATQRPTKLLVGAQLDRRLKQQRTKEYLEVMTRLDASAHKQDPQMLERVVAAINNEFGDLSIEQQPLGFVQKCILGPGYEVHILDVKGTRIIRHYKVGESMPEPFEEARALAIFPGYAVLNTYYCVEVFSDRLAPIMGNGIATYVDPKKLNK